MPAVIFAGSGAVHFLVVLPYQRLPPFRVAPYPVPKSVPDGLLFLRGKSGFLGIEDAPLLAVSILHGVVNADVAQVQAVLQYPVGVGPVGAVGGIGGHVAVWNAGLV